MKKMFTLILCCIILAGCSNEANHTDEEEVTESTYFEQEEILSENETEFIGAFEKAKYDKFNSYASENGLGDTLIYIEGKVLNQTKFDDSDSEIPVLALVVEQEDGNRWCVSVTSHSKIEEIDGKNVRIFGTYMGFSDVMNLPGMAVFIDDTEEMDEARIEIEENGEYVTVWRFSDYAKEEMSKQEQLETEESSVEEQSQENIEVYVPTTGEKNALRSAKNYLNVMPFSYNGLVKQLEYEKYSHDDAVYAAENCGADWNEQAAKSAKNYLEIMSFSKDGLIEQLEYDGFTHEQAVYGAEANGY